MMSGMQTLVAFTSAGGAVVAKTYYVNAYDSILQGNISFLSCRMGNRYETRSVLKVQDPYIPFTATSPFICTVPETKEGSERTGMFIITLEIINVFKGLNILNPAQKPKTAYISV
ncbi:hypothetical protein ZOSMA_288G00260 [Zostera marina]|uniref:Uncharacterized protein n=1 Tax=Zostera marina TaxID=29655 RepID=A0A0K9PCY6_ZOSMR|nr:hypothetical protein ZOSMA_288G00260 [Zostera marina]